MQKLLVIEDEPIISKLYKRQFDKFVNIDVTFASSFKEAMAIIYNNKFDHYIIDYNLEAGFTGIDIIKILQKEENIFNRIIMISATEDQEVLIDAYKLGVSNFLSKPVNFPVLNAILHRNIKMRLGQHNRELNLKNIELNPIEGMCNIKQNKMLVPVDLTPTQTKILYAIAKNPGSIINKETLSYLGKDSQEPLDNKTIEMHIANIRKKHEVLASCIKTKRGYGYYWYE
jgi:two-component system, OmpR family, response regulator